MHSQVALKTSGHLVENWCFTEVLKARWHRGLPDGLHHWRASGGHEVDLLLSADGQLHPIEIKASQTADPSLADGLRWWRDTAAKKRLTNTGCGLLIYGDEQVLQLGVDRLEPWHAIGTALMEFGP